MTQKCRLANDLERLLAEVAREPAARPVQSSLPRSTLFDLSPCKESTGRSCIAYPGKTIQIGDRKTGLGQEQEPYIPLALAGHATMPDVRDAEVLQLLVSRGLTAIGCEMTIEELVRTYGVGRWRDFWDVIYLPPAPLFAENVQPYFVQNDISLRLPPSTFYCDFAPLQDGHRNYELALNRLTGTFLQNPENTSVQNTWSSTWSFGEISINIMTFIRERSPGHNPLYERHPDLWKQCRITVERDWIRKLSPAEQTRLLSMPETDVLPFHPKWAPRTSSLRLLERGLLRRTPAQSNPFLWKNAEAGQLGWHAGQFAAFFARDACLGLKLVQVIAYRGGGFSWLLLELKNPFSDAHERVEIELMRGEDTHTLDEIAAQLAAFWELPPKTVESVND